VCYISVVFLRHSVYVIVYFVSRLFATKIYDVKTDVSVFFLAE